MESIWAAETRIRKRIPLPGDLETEAVVIGAGMAGILTAYYLQQAGIGTIVLEADRIGSGQTKNTTAKITCQHNLIYDRLIRTQGSRAAFAYASANEDAIEAYERLIREKDIACDFVRCPAYLYSRKGEALLRQEVKAAASIGVDAAFDTDSELPFLVSGVARFDRQACFDPLKFLSAVSEEVTVYERTKVLKVVGNQAVTDKGCVTARHIIFACHYPFVNIPGYYFARMYQERSYAVALEGADRIEGMYLGIDRDGLSFRQQGERLLLGGGSHRTGRNKKGGQYAGLQNRAKAFYPGSRDQELVGAGLHDAGWDSLYRTFFCPQAGVVCGDGIWKVGNVVVYGGGTYSDGTDHRAKMPGSEGLFTAEKADIRSSTGAGCS